MTANFRAAEMTPAMLSRKYEEEQYAKYGLQKHKECTYT